MELIQNNLPSNYWDTYADKIQAVTPEDVMRVARKYLGGGNIQLMVVGEKKLIQTGMEIDQRLSELETRARLNGWAAGAGFLYPVTLDRLSVWAKGLSDRGLALVPASAIVAPTK